RPTASAFTTLILALPVTGGGTLPPWPLFSALGLSTRSSSNGISNVSPSSKAIISALASRSNTRSVGQGRGVIASAVMALLYNTRFPDARSASRDPWINTLESEWPLGPGSPLRFGRETWGRSFVRSQFSGFVDQHDRHAVADGVGEAGAFADQFLALAIVAPRFSRRRADEHFQELGIDLAHWIGR